MWMLWSAIMSPATFLGSSESLLTRTRGSRSRCESCAAYALVLLLLLQYNATLEAQRTLVVCHLMRTLY
jgi:hypothetical protein